MNNKLHEAILGKLRAEDIRIANYSTTRAKRILAQCVGAKFLLDHLQDYEPEVLEDLAHIEQAGWDSLPLRRESERLNQ